MYYRTTVAQTKQKVSSWQLRPREEIQDTVKKMEPIMSMKVMMFRPKQPLVVSNLACPEQESRT